MRIELLAIDKDRGLDTSFFEATVLLFSYLDKKPAYAIAFYAALLCHVSRRATTSQYHLYHE